MNFFNEKKHKYFIYILFVIIFTMNNKSYAVDLILIGKVVGGINTFRNAFVTIDETNTFFEEIIDNKNNENYEGEVPVSFRELGKSYEQFSNDLRNAPLFVPINFSNLEVRIEEFTNCETRSNAFEKLNNYNILLNKLKVEGEQSILVLETTLEEVNTTFKALNILKEEYQKLSGFPVFGSIALNAWLEIFNYTIPGLANAAFFKVVVAKKFKQPIYFALD